MSELEENQESISVPEEKVFDYPQSVQLNRELIKGYIKGLPKKYKDISFASILTRKGVMWGVRIIYQGQQFEFEAGGDMEEDIHFLELINLKIGDLCLS